MATDTQKEPRDPPQFECSECGETLVRANLPAGDRRDALVEVASGQPHECWQNLPPDAEHLRLD